MRIVIAKETFSRIISLLTSELKIDGALLYMALDTKKIGAEVFEEPQNMVLEENGEDKMVRKSN